MTWSIFHQKCNSCGTKEWKHKGKGFCFKCYPLIKKKETIIQWDASNKKTLKAVGPIGVQAINRLISSGDFEKAKESLLSEIDSKLHLYKIYNSEENIEPLTIENFLQRISALTNNVTDSRLFHGAVTRYQNNFTTDQLKIIGKDLAFILINRKLALNIWRELF